MAEERKNEIGEWSSKIISDNSDLSYHDKDLIRLIDILYEGDYKSINDDLKERLGNRPFHSKLFQRINEDLERLKTLESRFPYK